MTHYDEPIKIEEQISLMRKYVTFRNKTRIERMLKYTGYFRLSRYGKYLLSLTSVTKTKPTQDLLFDVYNFDVNLRKIMFNYCKKAEIQFRSHLSNAVSISVNDSLFYIDKQYYTPSKGENDKKKKESNRRNFEKFYKGLSAQVKSLRDNVNKYPELKEYRVGGSRSKKKIPCWAVFSYIEFGTLTKIYSYLRGDLRKAVLSYGYSENNYGKEVTKQVDTWLDAIRNLRNICAHHNKLVGKTSSIVLIEKDDLDILISDTDLFSRLYALKKILGVSDSKQLKSDLLKLLSKTKINVYQFGILPEDWEARFDRIKEL